MLMSQSVTQYHMPAEWEPHSGTWIAWPHRTSDWPGKFSAIPWVYAEIVRTLSRFERVNIVVRDSAMAARVTNILNKAHADLSQVQLLIQPTDRSWVRDSGPIFVRDTAGMLVALDWRFNAWAKYPDWHNDDKLPAAITRTSRFPTVQPKWNIHRIVLEGGSIDVNGCGSMLTTEECLLSTIQQRNPVLDRAGYESVFAQYLGIKNVIWLEKGIVGDDTHGHVDDLARFVNARTVVTVVEENPGDANFELLRINWERLLSARDEAGRKLTVVPLPMPAPIVFRGQRLPASYANFYIANDVVMVPTFNDINDRIALGTLSELFPDRVVVGIHCTDLVWGLGTLHCMTQQEPE